MKITYGNCGHAPIYLTPGTTPQDLQSSQNSDVQSKAWCPHKIERTCMHIASISKQIA